MNTKKGLIWVAPAAWLLMLIGWQQLFHVPYNRQLNDGGKIEKTPLPHYQVLTVINASLPLHYLDPFGAHPIELEKRSFVEFWPTPGKLKREQMSAIEMELKSIENDILSEDMNFTLSMNRQIWIQPFEFTQLARQGIWDPKQWIDAINDKTFGALVLMFDLTAAIQSPVEATILSKAPEIGIRFQKDDALFQIQSGDVQGPLRVPWSGTIIETATDIGQRVKAGDLMAITAPDISTLASSQRFSPDVLDAMRKHYSFHKRIGMYRIYFPIQH